MQIDIDYGFNQLPDLNLKNKVEPSAFFPNYKNYIQEFEIANAIKERSAVMIFRDIDITVPGQDDPDFVRLFGNLQ